MVKAAIRRAFTVRGFSGCVGLVEIVGSDMTTFSVLVTGGCGFIGSNFIHYLLETDPHTCVVNFDALTYAGNPVNLASVAKDPRYRFVHGDITDRAAMRAVVGAGVQAIVH